VRHGAVPSANRPALAGCVREEGGIEDYSRGGGKQDRLYVCGNKVLWDVGQCTDRVGMVDIVERRLTGKQTEHLVRITSEEVGAGHSERGRFGMSVGSGPE
jgi:hypothetical protein